VTWLKFWKQSWLWNTMAVEKQLEWRPFPVCNSSRMSLCHSHDCIAVSVCFLNYYRNTFLRLAFQSWNNYPLSVHAVIRLWIVNKLFETTSKERFCLHREVFWELAENHSAGRASRIQSTRTERVQTRNVADKQKSYTYYNSLII
jgi:hypothetical protein